MGVWVLNNIRLDHCAPYTDELAEIAGQLVFGEGARVRPVSEPFNIPSVVG